MCWSQLSPPALLSAPQLMETILHRRFCDVEQFAARHLHRINIVPSTRRATLGGRALPASAAWAWNALPSSVKTLSTYLAFRRQLKTLLFKASFEDRT